MRRTYLGAFVVVLLSGALLATETEAVGGEWIVTVSAVPAHRGFAIGGGDEGGEHIRFGGGEEGDSSVEFGGGEQGEEHIEFLGGGEEGHEGVEFTHGGDGEHGGVEFSVGFGLDGVLRFNGAPVAGYDPDVIHTVTVVLSEGDDGWEARITVEGGGAEHLLACPLDSAPAWVGARAAEIVSFEACRAG